MEKVQNKAVLVTTEFRGVFFGFVKDNSDLPNKITLTDSRNCLYWDRSIGGFLGLATVGPNSECRIGKMVKETTLWKITSVTLCSKEAIEAWKK